MLQTGHQRSDLDSHADTTAVSEETALITHDYNTPVHISGYNKSVGKLVCQTVTAVVAYDGFDSKTYYLHFHQALLIPDLTNNLLCPMQMRDIGIRVNDEPKHTVTNPTEYHHAITIPATSDRNELILPLSMEGVTHYLPTRRPTQEEYDKSNPEQHIVMTASEPEWDPARTDFGQSEEAMIDVYGRMRERVQPPVDDRIISSIVSLQEGGHIVDEDLCSALESQCRISAVSTGERKPSVNAQTLAQRWGISLKTAEKTIEATTQRSVRQLSGGKLVRRYRTNDRKFRYRRIATTIFTDTMFAKTKSWFRKNKMAQVFTTNFGWKRAYPMEAKSDAYKQLRKVFQDVGVPNLIVVDHAKEQVQGDFKRLATSHGARVKSTEPYSPWQQAAEGAIRELKRASLRKQLRKQSPDKLWDHCIELEAMIQSHTALNYPELEGQVPETIMTGQTADISPYIEHEWYDWVFAFDTGRQYPNDKEILGRYLGPARNVGPAMCAKILKRNGQILYTSTYRSLTPKELRDNELSNERRAFDTDILERLGGPVNPTRNADTPEHQAYGDEVQEAALIPDIDDATPEYQDQYIGSEVVLPLQGTMKAGKVKRRSRTENGDLFGKAHDNPILDTRSYDVEFPDGTVNSYTANIIAVNMMAQCDENGNHLAILDGIVDHKTDGTEVLHKDRYIVHGNNRHHVKTTKGWKMCVQWKDGSTSWVNLADLKESYPVEVAEYAVSRGIDGMPAFAWWVPHVLKKRDRIISAVAKRFVKKTHKFGVEIPTSVEHAYELDRINGNKLWTEAIEKEISCVRVAFKVVDESDIPKGYQFMNCHMIFDVKMEANFRRKARMVGNGCETKVPSVPTYASVVARDTVRVALTYAALNDLEVKASDIQNAFLSAPCEEKIYTRLGPEFGPDEGKYAILTRALYGLKSASASFNRHLADCMRHLGYTACKADPDLWMRMEQRPDDGVWYYSYILFYVDDCLCIRHDAEEKLKEIDKFFPMKPGSIGDPDIYLGAKLRKVTLNNGVQCWALSPTKYINEALATAAAYVKKEYGIDKFPKTGSGPWPNGYVPETDESKELDPKKANYYQSIVGIMNWIVELGRVDIITEVSTLASHMALPREGHFDAALHVLGYLKRKANARMVFDPTYPDIDQDQFTTYDWTRFYGDVKEAIPDNAPSPLGKPVDLRMMVDADFANDKVRRRSRTGFFIFMNSALVMWLSKRQATVETSVFGAEFVAMKQGIETLRGLRYKLRMMGIAISGPSYIYGDNMSVVNNSSKPESTLNKKSNQVCYHAVREAVAMGECLITHVPTNDNLGDLATKLIPGGIKRSRLVDRLLYDVESKATLN